MATALRKDPAPLVSIGMPIYNSARQLRQSIDSLLTQTFADFELIISDNASTDGTPDICREYQERDRRVRYIRQARNLGAPRNWNAVLQEAKGEYFKWASGTDFCAPTMLEHCVEALSRDPDAVLCFGRTELVDEEGRSLGVYPGDLGVPDGRASDRYERVRKGLELNNVQQAVVRTGILRRTRIDRYYPGGDLTLTAELALYGRFLLLEEVLLYRRQSPGTFMSMRTPAEVQKIYNPESPRPMKVVCGRFHWDHLISILRAPLPWVEKGRALGCTMRFARWDRDRIWGEFLSLWKPTPLAG